MKFFQSTLFQMHIQPGIFFGLGMGLLNNSFVIGVFNGLFFGIFWGLAMRAFGKRRRKKAQALIGQISKDHTVVLDAAATLFVGKEGIGGWLFLTEDSLIFKPHT